MVLKRFGMEISSASIRQSRSIYKLFLRFAQRTREQFVRRRRPILRSFLLVLVLFLAFTAWKVFEYSAAPDKDKESDFVFPPNPDQGKPTTLAMDAASLPVKFAQSGGFTNDA